MIFASPVRLLAAVAIAVFAAIAAAQTDGTLNVHGNVARPLALSIADLRRLPSHAVHYAPRRHGDASSAPRRYTGCLLREVVDAAKPIEARPRDLRRSYVVATASDGYEVVFSWAELFASPASESVYVVYERDGEPIGADEGPIALVATSDASPMRHVKWLHALTVRRAE